MLWLASRACLPHARHLAITPRIGQGDGNMRGQAVYLPQLR
jgi:hypothetical protein